MNRGEFEELYRPSFKWPVGSNGPFDISVARSNLTDMRAVLCRCQVPFMLAFGTALGAYRESGLIAHDFDTDVAVRVEHLPALYDAVKQLTEIGFTVARSGTNFFSVARNGEYIDFYAFEPSIGKWTCYHHWLLDNEIEQPDTAEMWGLQWHIPGNIERYLGRLYGPDWRTPIAGKHATC